MTFLDSKPTSFSMATICHSQEIRDNHEYNHEDDDYAGPFAWQEWVLVTGMDANPRGGA